MRVGLDVGIHAQSHARLHAAPVRQSVDQRQLRLRFAIENENSGGQRRVDFGRGFADAREYDLLGIAAGLQHAKQLAAGNDVESRSGLGQQPQHGQVAIGLHRVADGVRQLRRRLRRRRGSSREWLRAEYT